MKFEPYPEYKDSGVEWIGDMPETWKSHKINQIFEIIGSGTTPKSQEELYYEKGVIPWVITGDLNDSILNETSKKISREAFRDHSTLKLYGKNSLIIAMYGATIGKISLLNLEACVNQACCVLGNSKILDIKFVFYWFLANKTHIISLGYGGGQPNISQDTIKSLRIQVPSTLEQEKIISFLDKKTSEIDLTIEKDTRLIELLKEKRTAMINHVVTKGLDPTVKMKDSGVEWIGEIPEDWDARKLKLFVSKIGSGITPKGGSSVYVEEGIALLRSQNIHFDGLRLKNVSYITEEINQAMLNSVVKNKDVLLNITGASIGRCTYFENQVDRANVNQHVCIIRPEKIYHKFLNYVLMSDLGQDQIFSTQMGSSREGVNFEQIGNFIVTYPPYEQQKDIADYLDKSTQKIDLTIQKIEENIGLLDEYKKSLIHHVVTGKVNVIKED